MTSETGRVRPVELWRRLRLGQKVSLAVVAACLPLVMLGVQVSDFAADMLREQMLDNVKLVDQVEADRIESSLDTAIERIRSIEEDPDFEGLLEGLSGLQTGAGATPAQVTTFLETTLERLRTEGLVGVQLRVSGEDPSYSYAGEVSPDSDAVRQKLGTGDLLVGDAFLSRGEPRVGIVQRVRANSSGSAMWLVTEWDLQTLAGSTEPPDVLSTQTRTVLLQPTSDGEYETILDSDSPIVGSKFDLQTNPNSYDPSPVRDSVDSNGASVVQAAARVDGDPGWVIVLEVDRDELFAGVTTVRSWVISVVVGSGVAILAVVAIAMRGFARRLGRMTVLAEAVASGDLTVRTDDHRLDELGRLSLAFDDMTQALAQDIARRERMEAQLAYQASHDALTGLPNRHQLVIELAEALDKAHDQEISVLFVDLDGFKAVNDRYGHGAGDDLLVRVAERLRDVLRPGDFLARLGGDEFVIVLEGLGIDDAESLASRIVSVLEMPFIAGGAEVQISASIGVSSGADERSPERLLKQADVAMYRAKAMGKGRAVRVSDDSLDEAADKVSIVKDLALAIENDELDLLLWPIADLESGSVMGMEATVRWQCPERGLVLPADFLPLAEEAGMSTRIDEWVIRKSIKSLADWRDRGIDIDDLELSVNLTSEMFLSPRSRHLLSEELGRNGLRAANVRIEVPESVLRSDDTILKEVFDTYRAVGMAVTLDKFGSDFTNLDRLARYAVDAVKIDLGIISGLGSEESTRALVSSLISLAFTAGLRVSAAGVDNNLIREHLIEMGCGKGQGLWLSSALTAEQFAEMLRSREYIDIA